MKYSFLLQLTAKFLKFFLLAILGFAIAYILSVSFGAVNIVTVLLPLARNWFGKLGIILLCLMTITVILESLR
ncbi:hypothetical protein ACF3DV_22380 [Chlorogloeopsis fritschii PCC 9212]|jgi:hypothetical protein|uniref:Uncharacterized protein n=1 Tax=Chlorogloeopsis fritschii PCC 6912 TaxID=211165 RepID=A0A433N4H5_CHLFR|nr:hypothetical protein [Chlorogloeopsis fritschii]MBF2003916.1 hypothetical protein [Chlorogloeopsis fritschii C42_A2020_084]RUR76229.1 hypothetical protein PCC6912_44010 [Chlorogloeopsis fritschii PCC 6912]